MIELLLLAGMSSLVCPQEEPAELLRMRDGRILVCDILEHNLDGLSVVSLRDGGAYELSWSDLFPGEADRMRSELGYKIETAIPEVPADKLLLVNSQVMIGRIVGRDQDNIHLRTFDNTSIIPLTRLAAPPEPVMVPASDVLTPEQFYQERVSTVDSNDPLKLFSFALELQFVFALDRSIEVLDQAEALATNESSLPTRIQNMRRSVSLVLENRVQAEALESIRHRIHRKRFAEAEEMLLEFEEDNPNSPLQVEYKDLVDRFEEQRVSAMEDYLTRNWYGRTVAIVKKRALERDASVSELQTWAETELPQLVREELLSELQVMKADIQIEDLDALWQARVDYGAKRHQAGYGVGSWILGEDRAREGLDIVDESEDEGKSEELKALEERAKRYLDNLDRARRQSTGDDEQSPEDWWRKAGANSRFQWLMAYYAENSGDYELTHVSFVDCATCAGSGVIRSIDLGSQGGKTRKSPCPTCHTIGIRRSITFR
ncbi:MAG TPA: hypothetical protein QGG59_03925 [Planctomycetota bacterium]|jgi:hypothetical protein|nr:hypothetical protein [Planctomycetota bacterium]HJM39247.1 hypothetical protein [Planctomycetota bacterium]|tara:strand:- start:2040 stop:3506 length:1467 start_codon:yes stop_codon:yes gene_type:complete